LANGRENLLVYNLRDERVAKISKVKCRSEVNKITNAKSWWKYIKPYVESLVLFH